MTDVDRKGKGRLIDYICPVDAGESAKKMAAHDGFVDDNGIFIASLEFPLLSLNSTATPVAFSSKWLPMVIVFTHYVSAVLTNAKLRSPSVALRS